MTARPPKLSAWSENLVTQAPDVFAVKPSVPQSWQYYCGSVGYWLPNALNRSKASRKAIRQRR